MPDDVIGVDDGDVLMTAAGVVRDMSDVCDDGCGTGGGGGAGGLSSYRPPFIMVHQLSPGPPAVGVGHPAPVVTSCSPPPYSVPTAASPRSPMMIIVVVSHGVRRETAGHAGVGSGVVVSGGGGGGGGSGGVDKDDGPIWSATKHKTSPDQFRVFLQVKKLYISCHIIIL